MRNLKKARSFGFVNPDKDMIIWGYRCICIFFHIHTHDLYEPMMPVKFHHMFSFCWVCCPGHQSSRCTFNWWGRDTPNTDQAIQVVARFFILSEVFRLGIARLHKAVFSGKKK